VAVIFWGAKDIKQFWIPSEIEQSVKVEKFLVILGELQFPSAYKEWGALPFRVEVSVI
jgi:hypothetical protein